MNRKEIQRHLEELYESGHPDISVECWQDQPNTAVSIAIWGRGLVQAELPSHAVVEAYGFAKVRWPDQFDAEHGKDLAVRKALAKIARKLADLDQMPESSVKEDLYTLVAARMFEIPADEVTPEQRQTAKDTVMGVEYGRSPLPNQTALEGKHPDVGSV